MKGFKDFLSNIQETSSDNEGESFDLRTEAISFTTRRQRAVRAKRLQSKLKRQRTIQLKKAAGQERLKLRGRRTARDFLTKLFYGGKSKRGMNIAQKARAEKRLDKAKGAVGRISKRLLPSKRDIDISRRQK